MAINHTEIKNWTIEDLVVALSDNPTKKNKIVIPKYQRTLVWKKDQKKLFIDSIKQGFPVGAILLFKSSSDNEGKTFYHLIDGLQRSTSIKDFIESPTQFFDKTNLKSELIDDLYDLVKTESNIIDKDILTNEIVHWINNLKGFEESDGFSSFDLSTHLNSLLSLKLEIINIQDLTSKFKPFLKGIKDDSNISQFQIPVLVYTGKHSNLPAIFERLNSKGTQLSKYQIYAASWSSYSDFTILNSEVIDGIKSKYDLLLKNGYEVVDYDPSPKFYVSKFSTFEYLFGFGKFLCTKYDYLFSSAIKVEQEDSIGFNIVNICLGLPFSEMNKIPEMLLKNDIQKFENSIISSIDFVFSALKGHITLKMNRKNSTTRIAIAHSELQIVSMIGKVFHSKYNSDLTEKMTWESTKQNLEQNLPYYYLYDIIRDHWKGSGDSNAFTLITSDRYETPIKRTLWESAFNEWLENDLSKKEKVRISIKDSAILFFKYLYTYSLSAHDELSSTEYEIEHLVPVDKLKEIAGEEGIPMSAFPNLCLLGSNINRKKGSFTYYQYFKKQVDDGELSAEQAKFESEKLEKYTHVSESELKFVDEEFTAEKYKQFLHNRYNKLKELFFDLNKIK